ncbi:MAG: hypothetical protein NVS3B20_17520 [Polyangiales bacterium]
MSFEYEIRPVDEAHIGKLREALEQLLLGEPSVVESAPNALALRDAESPSRSWDVKLFFQHDSVLIDAYNPSSRAFRTLLKRALTEVRTVVPFGIYEAGDDAPVSLASVFHYPE